ncbi:MAG TPA: hypothetical protein VHO90_16255, partial [Bacteroidales bacterium]|nr:hypothetical protein [Bacteroidales bacterium]
GGTVGMMRAVGWNIRNRTIWKSGSIACLGATQYCFNWASNYQYVQGNLDGLYRRYYYVIETGVYEGLNVGSYTASSEQVYYDVINGRVPDPIVGRCVYGFMTGTRCDGSCSSSGLWDSFPPSQSGPEFRAGKLQWYSQAEWPFERCYEFVPMSTPTGSFCGVNCWASKGVICPVKTILSGTKTSDRSTFPDSPVSNVPSDSPHHANSTSAPFCLPINCPNHVISSSTGPIRVTTVGCCPSGHNSYCRSIRCGLESDILLQLASGDLVSLGRYKQTFMNSARRDKF